jgi:hypothetical protein
MIHLVKKVSIKDIRSSFAFNNKNISHRLEDLYVDYAREYHNNLIFEDLSFSINLKNNLIICPVTLDTNKTNGIKSLSYYGDYIDILSNLKPDKEELKIIYDYLNCILEKHNIKYLKIKIKENNIFNQDLIKNHNPDSVIQELNINLRLTIEEILANATFEFRNIIKKNYSELTYDIINKDNYNNSEIFKMQKLHLDVSEFQSRSDLTWVINEKMILNDNGFIIRVKNKEKVISYNFFIYNKTTCSYHSSCTLREFFFKFRNISYKTLFIAIKYLKKINCNNFLVGYKTLFSKKELTIKEKNIEFFKSRLIKTKETSDMYFCYSRLEKNILNINDLKK